jgi:acetylxylan esterase
MITIAKDVTSTAGVAITSLNSPCGGAPLPAPAGSTATAAGLIEISGFGVNPTNLRMYLYRPARLAARPAILVALHNCTQSGPDFASGPAAEFVALAERHGYLMIFPTATREGTCFDVSSPASLRHDGDSDPAGIVSMVRHIQARYQTTGVFVVGLSSGAMMTNVLLGCYPDVFAAGAVFAGVPFGGFASDVGSWSDECAQGRLIRTPQQWGDLVRAAFPGYTGPWPRVQLWHSTTDEILHYTNLAEAIKQWTDVHGVPLHPVGTDQPRPRWRRARYGDAGDTAAVEAISVTGSPHNVLTTGMAAYAIDFFALANPPRAAG